MTMSWLFSSFTVILVWACCTVADQQDETECSTRCKPTILYPEDQSYLYLLPGVDVLTLCCKAYGNPEPFVQWVLNTLPISNYSHRGHAFIVHEKTMDTTTKIVSLNLTGSRAQLPNYSEFICVALNEVGLDEHAIIVNIQDDKDNMGTPETASYFVKPFIIIGLVVISIAIIILWLIVHILSWPWHLSTNVSLNEPLNNTIKILEPMRNSQDDVYTSSDVEEQCEQLDSIVGDWVFSEHLYQKELPLSVLDTLPQSHSCHSPCVSNLDQKISPLQFQSSLHLDTYGWSQLPFSSCVPSNATHVTVPRRLHRSSWSSSTPISSLNKPLGLNNRQYDPVFNDQNSCKMTNGNSLLLLNNVEACSDAAMPTPMPLFSQTLPRKIHFNFSSGSNSAVQVNTRCNVNKVSFQTKTSSSQQSEILSRSPSILTSSLLFEEENYCGTIV